MAVAKIMDQLTDAMGLDEHMRELAHICAVFHDVGRFEQIRRYNTFLDYYSVDHADLGCQVLEEEKFLEGYTKAEQKMILTAIRNHNKFAIEEGLDEDTLLLCKLIRDADKCDIFRVFACEDMVDTMGESDEQVAGETLSAPVFASIKRHTCVKRENRVTGLDIWVSFLAFVFDLYFQESVQIVTEQGYYRKPFDRVTFTEPAAREQVKEILGEVENYMKNYDEISRQLG
jgi:HD superfamily phosphohydrolase YqeK